MVDIRSGSQSIDERTCPANSAGARSRQADRTGPQLGAQAVHKRIGASVAVDLDERERPSRLVTGSMASIAGLHTSSLRHRKRKDSRLETA